MAKLTIKEEKFCLEYVKTGNGSKSAIEAGYSAKTSRAIASKLLTKVYISERIQHLKDNIAETLGLNAVKVANELSKIAFTNISDTRTSWMTLKDFKKLPEETKAAISEVQHESKIVDGKKVVMVKIKMHNKLDALKEINNMLGYNAAKKVEMTGNNGTPLFTGLQCEVVFKDYTKPNA